ncbi:MAG: GH116 family glycosyl hydrolase [Candidatus Methanomethylicaceae archaeon]
MYCSFLPEFYNKVRVFPGEAREVAFPLGGIGTGNVSLGARGELKDWEIFNKPGKGIHFPYAFFALWVRSGSRRPYLRILESRVQPPFSKSHGFSPGELAGLPRFEKSWMTVIYPFVQVVFEDKALPVRAVLEAFNPFIPLDPDNSGIPCVFFRYRMKNVSKERLEISVVASLPNMIGFKGYGDFGRLQFVGKRRNEYRDEGAFRGLFFLSDISPNHLGFGTMALVTTEKSISAKPTWYEGGWFDGAHEFWDDFCEDGRLEEPKEIQLMGNEFLLSKSDIKVGSLAVHGALEAEEEKDFEFILTWHFPNRPASWDTMDSNDSNAGCSCGEVTRNYYATLFTDSWDVAKYVVEKREWLEQKSRDFARALYGSTLPWYVIEALVNGIVVLRSTTCFRIEDGTFLGYEGCFDTKGCCPGSCTHVWNYAQTVAFLFPELEKSTRKVEFLRETDEEGRMRFRTIRAFGMDRKWRTDEVWGKLPPAADGQLGTIIRLYREWKLTGDNEFLKELWEKAAQALDFAIKYWDTDGDGVLDGAQHVTYDIELYGPNPLTSTLFYAALLAGREMARFVGDKERMIRYREIFIRGSHKMDTLLWNGEYYVQKLENTHQYRYQIGEGCLSDQLLGQFLAHVVGLGYLLPREKVSKAISSVFRYNFRTSFASHPNLHRAFVLGDEAGLLVCSWPRGGRPRFPLVYCDEVWTGTEYQVAAHLIWEGFVDEGLRLVRAVRERHDGYRRNPWNEVECGHHYARAMSSWALLLALSGFRYDMVQGVISFRPMVNQDDFSTFWSCGKAWGIYRQREKDGKIDWDIEVLGGSLEGILVNPCKRTGEECHERKLQ